MNLFLYAETETDQYRRSHLFILDPEVIYYVVPGSFAGLREYVMMKEFGPPEGGASLAPPLGSANAIERARYL